MDYLEEQKNELEALESIFIEDFTFISESPTVFTVRVTSDEYCSDEESLDCLRCYLKITYTKNYPDNLPEIEIVDSENLTDTDEEDLLNSTIEYGKENLGMAMVFSLVSHAQEWLNFKWDKLNKNRIEEAEIKIKQEEEEERKRFEGTLVTVESFLAWKQAFEDELGIYKKIKDKDSKKLTGRELFMLDQTLNESDLKFLSDVGDQVAVDESLFQDFDELDLDEELSDGE